MTVDRSHRMGGGHDLAGERVAKALVLCPPFVWQSQFRNGFRSTRSKASSLGLREGPARRSEAGLTPYRRKPRKPPLPAWVDQPPHPQPQLGAAPQPQLEQPQLDSQQLSQQLRHLCSQPNRWHLWPQPQPESQQLLQPELQPQLDSQP